LSPSANPGNMLWNHDYYCNYNGCCYHFAPVADIIVIITSTISTCEERLGGCNLVVRFNT
jgi:hypothetical protein